MFWGALRYYIVEAGFHGYIKSVHEINILYQSLNEI